jgi:predicted TIM-barrel fold metal-dependent hydrolase
MDDIIDVNTLFGPLPQASNDLTVESLLELMRQKGVGRACALSTLGLLLDPATGNAVTRATCAENTPLLPVATFNPTMYFGDREPLTRAKADGFCLIRFFPVQQGWPIDYAPFRALLTDLRDVSLPIMAGVSAPGDITALTRVLDGFPAPVILADVHSGLLSEAIVALREHPNWHLELSRLLAPGAIKAVADTVGAERLLFGTNAPSHPISSALDTLNFAGLSDAQRSQALGGNARRILGV